MRAPLRTAWFLLACAAVGLPATAGDEAPPDALRLAVAGNALVSLSREAAEARVPAWRGRPLAVRVWGGAAHPVRGAEHTDGLPDLVVLAYGGRPTVLEVGPADRAWGGRDPGEPIRVVEGAEPGVRRLARDEDRVFGDVASADPEVYAAPVPLWYLARIPRGAEAAIRLDPSPLRPLPEGTAVVRARVVGTHTGMTVLAARWGDQDLGTATAPRAAGVGVLTWRASLATAPSGPAAVLRLRDASPPPPQSGDPNDVSDGVGTVWVDAVELDAPSADGDGPSAVLADGAQVPLARVDLAGATPYRARTDPVATARGAPWLAIATEAALPEARRLAAHRAATGLPGAAAVTARDVWDRVSLGVPSAAALAGFLQAVCADGAGPRFVVLCGDAFRDGGEADGVEGIPTAYARTLYNGATASDRSLAAGTRSALAAGLPPAIGRLPFSDPSALAAYVDRVVSAETRPPADATRRRLEFVTSEGRFGPLVDGLLEGLFAQVLAEHVPAAYDARVTFTRARSPYAWPAASFADRVVDAMNEGALFYTYVGHGYAQGFDRVEHEGRRWPILDLDQVPKVEVRGTPPVVFVLACTTAIFDVPGLVGVGEALLARPRGPLAYWGATRVCHPAWNSLVGRQLAIEAFREPGRRLGEHIEAATAIALAAPPAADLQRRTIENGARLVLRGVRADLERLKGEGASMYALLGDPGLVVPRPREDLTVVAARVAEGAAVEATVRGPLPDGAEVEVALVVRRDAVVPLEADPSWSPQEAMRRRHARANDKAVARVVARASGGTATARLEVPERWRARPLWATAFSTAGGEARLGGTEVARP